MPKRVSRRSLRGSALVEFALGFAALFPIFAGLWQFGYTFYIYNLLQSAVRNGARYGAFAAYDSPTGNEFHARVKNMTVYGHPNPPSGAAAVVPGLTVNRITVTEQKDGAMPTRVAVQVDGFPVDAFFTTFTLNAKPSCRFDYAGQLLTP